MTSAALLANAQNPASSPAIGVVTANNHAVTSMADGQLDLFLNRMGTCICHIAAAAAAYRRVFICLYHWYLTLQRLHIYCSI